MKTQFDRNLIAVCGAAMSLLIVPRGLCSEISQTEELDRAVPFPVGGTLELHNFSGKVHITGTTGKDVAIHAVRRAKRELLDHIALDVHTSGPTVIIDANKRKPGWNDKNENVVETSFDIGVPSAANLKIEVFSSDLDIKGTSGAERLKTFSGNISVDAVSAGATPHLVAETFSGGIRCRLADSVRSQVNFSSFSGKFESELPLTLHSTRHERSAESATGTAGESNLTFKTFSGQVHVVK